jgi:hypothetical protein
VQAYQARAMDPARALEQAQITPTQLRDSDARISSGQLEALSAAAMRELDDEALGWFSRRLPWGSYGMLARLAERAHPGLALARWCRHHALLTDDILLQLQVEGEHARLVISERRDLGRLREFCLVTTLRNALGVSSWFVDSRLPVLAAEFPFAAPPHAGAYAVLFSGPTRFDAHQAAVRFDARYLALPVTRDEAAMHQMLQRALPLIVRPYRRDRLLVQRVRQLLAAAPRPRTRRHAGRAAACVDAACTASSGRRRSLQALKDEVRVRARPSCCCARHRHQAVAQAWAFQRKELHPRLSRLDGAVAGRLPAPGACQFGGTGGQRLTYRRQHGRWTSISITDTGITRYSCQQQLYLLKRYSRLTVHARMLAWLSQETSGRHRWIIGLAPSTMTTTGDKLASTSSHRQSNGRHAADGMHAHDARAGCDQDRLHGRPIRYRRSRAGNRRSLGFRGCHRGHQQGWRHPGPQGGGSDPR